MNKNEVKDFLDRILAKCIEKGFEEGRAKYKYSTGFSLSIFEGSVSNYENCIEESLSFKGKLNKQVGSASTSVVNEDAIDFLVDSALDNQQIKDDEDEDFFYCDKDNPNLFYNDTSDAANKNNYDSFKDLGLKLEKAILDSDESIKAVDYLQIGYSSGFRATKNTLGLDLHYEGDLITIGAEARCERDGVVKTGYHIWYGIDIDKFKIDEFVDELCKRTVTKLGANSVKSGVYDVILSQDAFVSLFSSFAGSLSAYSIQKKISLFKDLVNKEVATNILTISELPSYDKALAKFPFDYSGVLTYDKDIIKDGVFVTPLYSVKTAHKDNVKPTGNDFDGIEYTNLVLKPGEKSFDELCKSIDNGLYITDLNGLHAGLNPISGDFSLLCEGFLIENGIKTCPVEQITVAGNYLNLLKNISEIGSDVKSISDGVGEFFCPSIVIKDMNISGES